MVEDLYKNEIATLRRLLEGDDGVDGLQQILDKAENDIRNSNIHFTYESKVTKPAPIFNKTPFSTSLVFEKKPDESGTNKLLTSSTSYFDKLLNGPDTNSFNEATTSCTKIFDNLKEPAKVPDEVVKVEAKVQSPSVAQLAKTYEKQKAEPVTTSLFERLKTEPTSLSKKVFSSSSHNLETPSNDTSKSLHSFMEKKKLKPREYTRTPYSNLAPDTTKQQTLDTKNTASTNALFEKYRGEKKVPYGGSMTLGRKLPEKEAEFKTTSLSFYNKSQTEKITPSFSSFKSEKKPEVSREKSPIFERLSTAEKTLTFDKKVPLTESFEVITESKKPVVTEVKTHRVFTTPNIETKPADFMTKINEPKEQEVPIIIENHRPQQQQQQEFAYTSPNQSQFSTFPIRCTINYFASPYRDQPTSRSNVPDYAKRYFQSLDQRQNGAYTQFFKYRNF